jgi:nitroreductase
MATFSPILTEGPRLTQPLTVAEAAEQRHSIRKYKPEPVPEADLREILRLVGLAPSAFNVQPWRFVVVRDPALKAQLGEAAYNQPQVTNAPAVIVLYTDMADFLETVDEVVHPGLPADRQEQTKQQLLGIYGGQSEEQREAWGLSQGNIALGYLMLVAQSLGYATSPMLGFDADKVKALLDLPAHVKLPAIVPIGVADEAGFPTHRHPVDRVASFR